MGTETLVTYWNEIMEELGKYFQFNHITPTYHNEYIKVELIKEPSNNPKPTVVTIQRNRVVVFSVNRKPDIPNLPVQQSEYSSGSQYGKGWTKIICNEGNIKAFLAQLNHISQYI